MITCEVDGCTLPAAWAVATWNTAPVHACEVHATDMVTEGLKARIGLAVTPFKQEPAQAS